MFRSLVFPLSVAVMYGVISIVTPAGAIKALKASAYILTRVSIALSLVFFLIFALNLFIKPAHLIKLFGKGSGVKGIAVSTLAGILSIGPIYAWYPLLQELKSRGMRESLIAIFLNCRAVKPVLLPVMISYFGWLYVLVFTFAMVLGALVCGAIVAIIV